MTEQRKALHGETVLHFRIPLKDEPGIELVPGTHLRWDTEEELDVRLERNSKKNSDDLSSGLRIQLEAGDLLVFSANMIHRGLYGMDRFSFDLLFGDSTKNLARFIDDDCLPSNEELLVLGESPFAPSIALRNYPVPQ